MSFVSTHMQSSGTARHGLHTLRCALMPNRFPKCRLTNSQFTHHQQCTKTQLLFSCQLWFFISLDVLVCISLWLIRAGITLHAGILPGLSKAVHAVVVSLCELLRASACLCPENAGSFNSVVTFGFYSPPALSST